MVKVWLGAYEKHTKAVEGAGPILEMILLDEGVGTPRITCFGKN